MFVYGKTSDHLEIDISAFSESNKSIFVHSSTLFVWLIIKALIETFNVNALINAINKNIENLRVTMGICAGKPATKTSEDPNSQVEPVENGYQVKFWLLVVYFYVLYFENY